MIFAVVPAAGHSTRMGQTKLSLPMQGRPILERVVVALRSGGVGEVVVVVGPHVPELAPLATDAGAHVCWLAEPTVDMRATVEHGLDWLEERFRPQADDGFLLAPADHPALDARTVRRLLDRYANDRSKTILTPVFRGRRDHPTLIAWRHVAGIRSHPREQGIDTYLRQFPDKSLELVVDDLGVLLDVDTPDDYGAKTPE